MQPLPAEPGQPERYDYEYVRNGTANLFMVSEPLAGLAARRGDRAADGQDFAEVLRWLVDVHDPDAEKVVLVMDNLNTHKPASLYEAFEPAEARRIADRLEIHYTPKHGSWLNMAEIELGVLAGSAWTGGWPIGRPWSGRSRRGRRRATGPSWGQLAVHHRTQAGQAQAPLPHNSRLTSY